MEKIDNSMLLNIAEYFDSIAEKWDSWEDDLKILNQRFKEGLEHFGIEKNENILEVGCGTGNLTKAILEMLSENGRIAAIDLSKKMIEISQQKVVDKRVRWICGAVENLEIESETFDRVICYSVWPHLNNHSSIARMFYNILKRNGRLHIWHLKSREEINSIHTKAHPIVMSHLLKPATETAQLLKECGFCIEEITENSSKYLITGTKK